MKKCRAAAGLALFLVVCLCGLALAAGAAALLQQGVEQYELAEFEKAQNILGQALNQGGLSPAQTAKAHAYIGLVHLALGRDQQASQAFGRAKAADPSYKLDPTLHQPAAVKLYQKAAPAASAAPPAVPPAPQAPPATSGASAKADDPDGPARPVKPAPAVTPAKPPAPAPPVEPKPIPVKPAAPAMPERGYVVEANGNEAVIDLGRGQGVKNGDYYEAFVTHSITHPVTGKTLTRVVRLALLRVSQVQQDLSIAKALEGRDKLKPGLRVRKTQAVKTAAKPKPKAEKKPAPVAHKPKTPAPPAPVAKKPQALLRLAVLKPMVSARSLENFDEDDYRASILARALDQVQDVKAVAVSGKQLGMLNEMRFNQAKFLLDKTFDIQKVKDTVTGDVEADSMKKLFVRLKPGQVAALRKVMDKLGVNGLLIWDVWNESSGNQVFFRVNVHMRGSNDPLVREDFTLDAWVAKNYPNVLKGHLQKNMPKLRKKAR